MEDRRQLDTGGDHVLGRTDPGAVPREARGHRFRQAGLARHRLEDARHLAGVEPLADPPALADRAEQPSFRDPGAVEPGVNQPDGVPTDPGDLAPSLAVGLGAADQKAAVARQFLKQIGDLQGNQFRPAEHGVVGDGEQRPVTVVDQSFPCRLQQALSERPCQPHRLVLPAALPTVHSLERKLHGRALDRLLQPERPVGDGEAGDVAAHRGRRPQLRLRIDECGDGLRPRRQRPFPLPRAPRGVDREIGLQRPLGVAAERAFGRPDELSEQLRKRGLAIRSRLLAGVERGFEIHARASGLEAVKRIDALFDIEREINGETAERRLAMRHERGAPLVAEFEAWMRTERAALSRHAAVAKAMDYMLKRWDGFTRFLDDGRICTTNNAAERALRPLCLGRRSWLFAGSDRGGARAAAMYTLIGTAKLNDVDPQAWLADVLDRIADLPQSRLHELLPWNWKAERQQALAA